MSAVNTAANSLYEALDAIRRMRYNVSDANIDIVYDRIRDVLNQLNHVGDSNAWLSDFIKK